MRFALCLLCLTTFVWTSNAQEMAQPTEQHERLNLDVGKWKGKMTLRMPGSPDPITMDVAEENRMFAGGLWLLSTFEMGPFKGHGQTGYDESKKKYVGTWVDNSSSRMNVMEGSYDEKNDTLTMTFRGLDEATGKEAEMKSVSRHDGKDKRTFTMFVSRDDQWVESFVIKYERTK